MVPLFKPFVPDIPRIDEIIKAGKLTYGDETIKFEKKLMEYFDTKYVLVTSTYQMAIYTALSTLGLNNGDDVIMSPMSCLVSTQPYQSFGLNVCWADIDPNRGTLNPKDVEKRITDGTKLIVHNHFCGYPGYIDEINMLGKKYNIPVIDDGIECFGAKYKGKKIGSCGTDVTIFSLGAVRFCNCIDGGVIIFKEKKLYDKALLIRDSGIDRRIFRDELGEISSSCDISLVGYNAMMSNVNGYLGACQMDFVDSILKKHYLQSKKWNEYFKGQNIKPIFCEDCEPNYWVYGILTDNKKDTISFFREMGFYASGVHMRNDIYSVFGNKKINLPGVEKFYNSFVALPCGWWME